MLRIACLCLALVAATPLWAQVEPSGSGGGSSLDDSQMMTPAPVSGGSYPGTVGSEERSNYLAGGLAFTGAYVDNLMVGNGTSPISDETYSFLPTIGFDRRTPRQAESLSYSSGFTLYQHTSAAQFRGAESRLPVTSFTSARIRSSSQRHLSAK